MAGTIIWVIIIVFLVFRGIKKNKQNLNKSMTTNAEQTVAPAYTSAPVQKPTKQKTNHPMPPKTPKAVAPKMKKSADPSIVQKAKQNANRYNSDQTLQQLETEHVHSERSEKAVAAYTVKAQQEHAAMHEAKAESMNTSLLGDLEDLMTCGYDGNLGFERDFVGEGLDMISHFTVS